MDIVVEDVGPVPTETLRPGPAASRTVPEQASPVQMEKPARTHSARTAQPEPGAETISDRATPVLTLDVHRNGQ